MRSRFNTSLNIRFNSFLNTPFCAAISVSSKYPGAYNAVYLSCKDKPSSVNVSFHFLRALWPFYVISFSRCNVSHANSETCSISWGFFNAHWISRAIIIRFDCNHQPSCMNVWLQLCFPIIPFFIVSQQINYAKSPCVIFKIPNTSLYSRCTSPLEQFSCHAIVSHSYRAEAIHSHFSWDPFLHYSSIPCWLFFNTGIVHLASLLGVSNVITSDH